MSPPVLVIPLAIPMIVRAVSQSNFTDAVTFAAFVLIVAGVFAYNARGIWSYMRRPPRALVSAEGDERTMEGSKDAGPWPCVRREEFKAEPHGIVIMPYKRPFITDIPFVTSDTESHIALIVCDFGFCFPVACGKSSSKCVSASEEIARKLSPVLGDQLPVVDLQGHAEFHADNPRPSLG